MLDLAFASHADYSLVRSGCGAALIGATLPPEFDAWEDREEASHLRSQRLRDRVEDIPLQGMHSRWDRQRWLRNMNAILVEKSLLRGGTGSGERQMGKVDSGRPPNQSRRLKDCTRARVYRADTCCDPFEAIALCIRSEKCGRKIVLMPCRPLRNCRDKSCKNRVCLPWSKYLLFRFLFRRHLPAIPSCCFRCFQTKFLHFQPISPRSV